MTLPGKAFLALFVVATVVGLFTADLELKAAMARSQFLLGWSWAMYVTGYHVRSLEE